MAQQQQQQLSNLVEHTLEGSWLQDAQSIHFLAMMTGLLALRNLPRVYRKRILKAQKRLATTTLKA